MNISESIQSSISTFAQDLFGLLRESILRDVRVALGVDSEPDSFPLEDLEASAVNFLHTKEDERLLNSTTMTSVRVEEALRRTDGNVRLAAQFLGVSPSTVKRYKARLKVALDSPIPVQKKKFATAKIIRETLKETGGNVAETMRRLGASRARINKYR